MKDQFNPGVQCSQIFNLKKFGERGRNRTYNLLIKSHHRWPRKMASKASESKELTQIQPIKKDPNMTAIAGPRTL